MIAALALALALLAGSPTVTPWEFRHVDLGDTRHHVEHVFDTPGVRVSQYADERGDQHRVKAYPAEGGGTVEVVYVRDVAGRAFRLVEKSEVGS